MFNIFESWSERIIALAIAIFSVIVPSPTPSLPALDPITPSAELAVSEKNATENIAVNTKIAAEPQKTLGPAVREEQQENRPEIEIDVDSLEIKSVVEPQNTVQISSQSAKTAATDIKTPNLPSGSFPLYTLPPELSEAFRKDSELKSALVNIYCVSRTKNLGSITGSGAIISPKGIILTNAHVGQYFLLARLAEKGGINCTIRTGNPAKPKYEAALVFISKDWVELNPRQITGEKSKGTGENDIALLLVTGSADGTELPPSFPFLEPKTNVKVKAGQDVTVAGYPAEFLPRGSVSTGLYALSATTTVDEVFTFTKSSVDLMLMKGSVVAQKGSSGGAVVNDENELIGIIATAGSHFDANNERNLHAITLSYVDRLLRKVLGEGLKSILGGDTASKTLEFRAETAPELEYILLKSIAEKSD